MVTVLFTIISVSKCVRLKKGHHFHLYIYMYVLD